MAFASGPVTFRRFLISGKFHNEANDTLIQALSDHAFGKSRTAPPDGIEIGWIAPTHLFDADITAEKIVYDRFLYFQMRIDRTKAPANIIKSYTRIEEQAAQDAAGKPYLNKQQRADARDRAVARAEKEEKSSLYRRITAVPILIDLSSGPRLFGPIQCFNLATRGLCQSNQPPR